MGGIGLSCNTTSTGYLTHAHKIRTQYAQDTHTIRTRYAHNTHTILHTHAHTIHTHNTQIQDTHIHLNNTEYRYNNHAAHTEQNNTGATENRTQNLNAHLFTHIVLTLLQD